MEKPNEIKYRKDIDGLRAISVLSVILFHMGYLSNGYLGVDVFFVISGFLITKIVYEQSLTNQFSITDFYLRRIRRIIPLVLFTCIVALILGVFLMLPEDLKILSQSIIATNLFSNNILLLITTADYWNVVNDLKPLMHTWSLGVEEQFYFLYPVIFLLFKGKKTKFILPILIVLTIISFVLYLLCQNEALKFYSIQFRFFELSLGGIGAIMFYGKKAKSNNYIPAFSIAVLLYILVFDGYLSSSLKTIVIVLFAATFLVFGDIQNKFSTYFLENKLMVSIGKISFSLYMWHQLVLAYMRYAVSYEIGIKEALAVFTIVILLSIASFYLIEEPFRNKKKVKTKTLLVVTSTLFVILCSVSLYLVSVKGIIRDVPELDLLRSKYIDNERNSLISYNERVFKLNKQFSENEKVKVLVIGNSFARDFSNILLESNFSDHIEISYVDDINSINEISNRLKKAEIVCFANLEFSEFNRIQQLVNFKDKKILNMGPKQFGNFQGNGIFYNANRNDLYYMQKFKLSDGLLNRNSRLKQQWSNNYIDLIEITKDINGEVPVFTSEGKFISPDGVHLTKAGAKFFAQKLNISYTFKSKK